MKNDKFKVAWDELEFLVSSDTETENPILGEGPPKLSKKWAMLNYWCERNQDILPEILKDEKKLTGLSFDYTATLWFAVNSPKSVITPFFGLNNSPCLGIPRDQKTFDMFCDAAQNMQKLKRLSEFSALLQEISHSLRIAQGGFSTIDGSKAFEIFTHLIASQKTIAEKHRVLDKFFPHSSLSRYDFAVPWLQFFKKRPQARQ